MKMGLNGDSGTKTTSKASFLETFLGGLYAVWSFFSFSYAAELIAQGNEGTIHITSALKWHPKDIYAKPLQHKFERIYASERVTS